jgi:DNA-binding NarL/FixJ family response regulator
VFASLSPNECEVSRRRDPGCSTKQIAAEIGRVEKTIEYHRKRIMEKLGVTTMVQAVRLATLHRWEWAGREGRAEI